MRLINRQAIRVGAAMALSLSTISIRDAKSDEFPPPRALSSQKQLPDPLIALDGSQISSVEQWNAKRRPELKALFEHYMYGRCPARPEHVEGKLLFEDRSAFGGKGTLREIELTFGPPNWPKIYLLAATPNDMAPAACFVGANFAGNHLLTDETRVRIPGCWMPESYAAVVDHHASEEARGKAANSWPLAEIVRRGYATATFCSGDIQPDRPDVHEGMRATLPNCDDPAQTATIMWWAWGVHRAVDYLATDEAIDRKRIAVVGHSRLGKTALLAGAFDERIALTIANQAGCGGSGPSRHHDPKAESVARINDHFPHWFCKNFHEFGADPSKLPFDQHDLVALCAPRPVLFTAASEDLWANPSGQFQVLKAATPVYRLLGAEGLEATSMPKAGDRLIDSRLGYWIRPGKHAMSPPDWQTYMDFADKWLK